MITDTFQSPERSSSNPDRLTRPEHGTGSLQDPIPHPGSERQDGPVIHHHGTSPKIDQVTHTVCVIDCTVVCAQIQTRKEIPGEKRLRHDTMSPSQDPFVPDPGAEGLDSQTLQDLLNQPFLLFLDMDCIPVHDALPHARCDLSGPLVRQDNFDGLHENDQVQDEGHILDIVDLIAEFFARLFCGPAILVLDLRPTGNTRSD